MATQDESPIDDHFHAVAFDNETQTLWATGGDIIDIIRRWNAQTGWEIVSTGFIQPTSIMFDDNWVYFGPDASTCFYRLNKKADVPVEGSAFEVVLDLGSEQYPGAQWMWEIRKINGVYYAPTNYNDGIFFVSINGRDWVEVFHDEGYYLPGYGVPSDPFAVLKGGIPSFSTRLPLYFVHNMQIFLLTIKASDIRMLYDRARVRMKDDLWFRVVIESSTFEPGEEDVWIEDGYGSTVITDEDAYAGSHSLKDEIPTGSRGASRLYPPNMNDWDVASKGSGEYCFEVWLRCNVSTQSISGQGNAYLNIEFKDGGGRVYTNPVRIVILETWQQFRHSVFVPGNATHVRSFVTVYRENGTARKLHLDDAVFWYKFYTEQRLFNNRQWRLARLWPEYGALFWR